jgi:hypothetical protein
MADVSFLPDELNISVPSGDAWILRLKFTGSNLNGYTTSALLYLNDIDPPVALTVTPVDFETLDISMTSAQMALIDDSAYKWRLRVTLSGQTTTLLGGLFILSGDCMTVNGMQTDGTVIINQSGISPVPTGGTTNQVLAKNSDTDFDFKWNDINVVAGVSSINGSTGVVVIDSDDISDTDKVHQFVTYGERLKLAGIEDLATYYTDGMADARVVAGIAAAGLTAGSTLLYGAGVPSSGTGVDGNFYIDTTAHYIYGPKATTWPTGVSIIGPPGAQGIPSGGTDGQFIAKDGATPFKTKFVSVAPGAGSNVSINGAAAGSPNFNGTTPAAPSGQQNVTFQVSGNSVSGYVPVSSGEMNVQSDWNQTTNTEDDYIKNKPTISGSNTGDETAARIAGINHGTSAKTALVDADEITGQDSEATFGLIRTTWTSVKSFLKTYFDGLYTLSNLGGVPTTRTITATTPITIDNTTSADLSANRTIAIPAATASVNGYATSTQITKLDGIAAGANAYVHPNHSGNVTSAADGATTIAAGVVTRAMMANLTGISVIGKSDAGAGSPAELSMSTLLTMLNTQQITVGTSAPSAGLWIDTN